jgi:CRP-like cAMP-binding protein
LDAANRVLAEAYRWMEEQVNVLKMIDLESGDGQVDAALAARICWHYFKEGQTQDVIAQRLKITRKRVNRILGEARESGLVQITIAGATGPLLRTRSASGGKV